MNVYPKLPEGNERTSFVQRENQRKKWSKIYFLTLLFISNTLLTFSQVDIGPTFNGSAFSYLLEDQQGFFKLGGRPNFGVGITSVFFINSEVSIRMQATLNSASFTGNLNFFELNIFDPTDPLNVEDDRTIYKQTSLNLTPSVHFSLLNSSRYQLSIGSGIINQVILTRRIYRK